MRGYLKQQYEYGKAEALLERKWPERYNRMGHLAWAGRVYGAPLAKVLGGRWKIYYGTWGTGLFQSVYQRAPGILGSLPLMPEWYLVIGLLPACRRSAPLDAAAAGGSAAASRPARSLLQVALGGARERRLANGSRCRERRMRLHDLPLHGSAGRPAAGRLRHGLSPWRAPLGATPGLPMPRTSSIWSERWRAPDERVPRVESRCAAAAA